MRRIKHIREFDFGNDNQNQNQSRPEYKGYRDGFGPVGWFFAGVASVFLLMLLAMVFGSM